MLLKVEYGRVSGLRVVAARESQPNSPIRNARKQIEILCLHTRPSASQFQTFEINRKVNMKRNQPPTSEFESKHSA